MPTSISFTRIPKPSKITFTRTIRLQFYVPKSKGFTFVYNPHLERDLGSWKWVDRGSKGEPHPVQDGEVAVVKLWCLDECGWRIVLSDKRKSFRKVLTGVGWCDNLKSPPVFMVQDPVTGQDHPYRNAVPRKMREEANAAAARYVSKLSKEQHEGIVAQILGRNYQTIDLNTKGKRKSRIIIHSSR